MAAAQAADTKPKILELVRLHLRNTQDNMAQRTNEFFSKAYFPALQRSGAGPLGAFNSVIAPDTPFLLLLLQFVKLLLQVVLLFSQQLHLLHGFLQLLM